MSDPIPFSPADVEPVLADLSSCSDQVLAGNVAEVIEALVEEIRGLREVVESCVFDGWFPSHTKESGWEWYAAVSSLPTDIPLTDELVAVIKRAGGIQ